MIKFSIIVPLYNCEKYISECIDSILSQKYPEFEIIVVNDGSTDNSRAMVERYCDSRIRIIDKVNGGLLHARLTGLREASNDYIVFVDADDRICSTLLQDIAFYFEQGNDVVVYKLVEFSEERYGPTSKGLYFNEQIFQGEDRRQLLTKLLTTGEINSIVCKAFKKDLIPMHIMEAYPRVAIGEDALFTMHLLQYYSRLTYLDYPYYEYRQFKGSMTHKLKLSNYTDNVFRFNLYYKLARQTFKEYEYQNISKQIDSLFFRMIVSSVINSKMRIDNKEDYQKYIEAIAKSKLFQEKVKESYHMQSFAYKLILKNIINRNIRRLLLFRQVLKYYLIFNNKF